MIPTKKITCINCGKQLDVSLSTNEDNYECIDCIGNDIDFSQTD